MEYFFLKNSSWRPCSIWRFFWHLFSRSSRIRQKLQKANLLRTNSKKNKKNCYQKINSKWPLNSRWLSKLNLLVKTTNHIFSKNNSGLFLTNFRASRKRCPKNAILNFWYLGIWTTYKANKNNLIKKTVCRC
jgi:hypothetical protein